MLVQSLQMALTSERIAFQLNKQKVKGLAGLVSGLGVESPPEGRVGRICCHNEHLMGELLAEDTGSSSLQRDFVAKRN